jgi:hypothetical protein
MIRDFYSGHRGQHMKEWVNSLYYVSDWLWESYREGAAPELNVVESIPSRRPIPYTPQPIDFVNAPPATKEIFYKQHIRSDPYQPFESYSVKTVHPYFENCSTEEIVSIRVKKTPNALQCTETAMHHFMRMLQLETQHGVLDADNTNDESVHPALMAGIWALSNLHDNFSQDPNAFDDPSFWLLQLLNHSLSRNHCYQKMTPGKRDHPRLTIPVTPTLALFQARNRAAVRSNVDLKYQRMFRALHLIVVQKICLVLRTRFKRLHQIDSTKNNRVDPTMFNKAAGFHKAHLNEAEDSWRKSTEGSIDEILKLQQKQQQQQQQQQPSTYPEEADIVHDNHCVIFSRLPETSKLTAESERLKLAMTFLQRNDLTLPICTTVGAIVNDVRAWKAKEVLFHRVNHIDQCIALHQIYSQFVLKRYEEDRFTNGQAQDKLLNQMRQAWKEGKAQLVSDLTTHFTERGASAVHDSTYNARAAFLKSVATGDISLNTFSHHSSFHGSENEDTYGCRVPDEWCAESGCKPKIGKESITVKNIGDILFPSNGGSLANASVCGPDGQLAAERNVLLMLLKELHDVLKLKSTELSHETVIHLPMSLVCSKKWGPQEKCYEISNEDFKQVRDYISKKENIRLQMDACLVSMKVTMQHVVKAAFRFVMLRSLPTNSNNNNNNNNNNNAVAACKQHHQLLPSRASDDRVAHVARAHLYLMIAISKRRNMRTISDQPIFCMKEHGLEMEDPPSWSETDWLGFSMITDVALSAESGRIGREQSSVPLFVLPPYMLSQCDIVELPVHLCGTHRTTTTTIDAMEKDARIRFGIAMTTSFLDLHPFHGPRCAQLLRLNWNAHKYLRVNSKTEDVYKFSKIHPWKDQPTFISHDDRREATAVYVREYERFVKKTSQIVDNNSNPQSSSSSSSSSPFVYNDTLDETDLFGLSSGEDDDDDSTQEGGTGRCTKIRRL